MLLTRFFCKNVPITLRFFSTSSRARPLCTKLPLNRQSSANFLKNRINQRQCRHCSSESQKNHVLLPALTDDQKLVWPAFFKTWKSFFTSNFVITPQLDKDFNIQDFSEGAKQALSVVTKALASEDYDSISDLVSGDCLQKLRQKISSLTPQQRFLIAVEKEDIYITFPYDIEVISGRDHNGQEYKFGEVMFIFHSLRGLNRMRLENREPPLNMGMLPEYQRLMFVSNCKFVKNFLKEDSIWTIKSLNHFMPINLEN
ncbi:uncharacterized protein LOC106654908 [Trichogramma pretiosum]|uniref:uncharacterized protein LOC106654908 n=1 Tax=Trichogramma pretiosum TaxID=7493 RepID=UPI0006C976A5|nr:uncharacterized protein LOC106654908 [Trichogramma pretiosum]